ncbi:hypothetical protein BQ8482_120111 [Mesorhizobium delmotii]|uniref:Uncharacterized protein n=1 Tax=Mesorhizobium delmotii TaxID=1631247 RepID=A0A2P9AG23_9HYPH|nr:hypothetical protein BQ8482_120111 [Mesorhizobium delmotii]
MFCRQRLMVRICMVEHLAEVTHVECLATDGAELEMPCFVVGRRPVAPALDAGCRGCWFDLVSRWSTPRF